MTIDTLNNLRLNEEAYILESNIKNKQNLINLGITKNSKRKYLYKSPFNNPNAYLIKNVIIALREEDTKQIKILRINNGTN